MSLSYLWRRLSEKGVDIDKIWQNMLETIVKSLVCVDDVIAWQPNAFEVFGYDLLIDEDLKAWLIEVNASPSMGCDSSMDTNIKINMVKDTLNVVRMHRMAAKVLERRSLVEVRRLIPSRSAAADSQRAFSSAWMSPGQRSADSMEQGQMTSEDSLLVMKINARYAPEPIEPRSCVTCVAHIAQLNMELGRILYNRKPRPYGEMPKHPGGYQRVAPGSAIYDKVVKLKRAHLRR